jgi:hypothetical protein
LISKSNTVVTVIVLPVMLSLLSRFIKSGMEKGIWLMLSFAYCDQI